MSTKSESAKPTVKTNDLPLRIEDSAAVKAGFLGGLIKKVGTTAGTAVKSS